MEKSGLEILKVLKFGPSTLKVISQRIGLSYTRTSALVKKLTLLGLVEKRGRLVALGALSHVLLPVMNRYDLVRLMAGSKERILGFLLIPRTVSELQSLTRLSLKYLYSTLSDLQSMNAVERGREGYIIRDVKLKEFLFLYWARRFSQVVGNEAEFVYLDPEVALFRFGKGQPTAFSAYSEYGIRYIPKEAQNIWPPNRPRPEAVLIHSLIFAETKKERGLAALFYLKVPMNAETLSTIAKRFGAFHKLKELERYVLRMEAPPGYPSFDEFEELMNLYGVSSRPVGLEPLKALAMRLKREVKAVLIGGGYLLMFGVKGATKDIDLVVNKLGYEEICSTLEEMGYRLVASTEGGAIYESADGARFDIFVDKVSGIGIPTEGEERVISKLRLILPRPEIVFLLKVISGRPIDLEDAYLMLKKLKIDSTVIWRLIEELESYSGRHVCLRALEGMEDLESQYDMRLPMVKRVRASTLRHMILYRLEGKMTAKELAHLLGYSEAHVRRQLSLLMRKGLICKEGKYYFKKFVA